MISALSPQLDTKNLQCISIVETPRNSRCKYSYDDTTGLFKLGFVLPEGLTFPFDFGFIPSTHSGDGDPLDVLVLIDEPSAVGVMVEIRLVGVFNAVQKEEGQSGKTAGKGKTTRNDRLLAVAVQSHTYRDISHIDQLSEALLTPIEQFFVSYTQLQGRIFTLEGRGGPKKAVKLLRAAMDAFDAEHAKPPREIVEQPDSTRRTRS
jgi:inorganic pyrophosphatase